MEVKLKDVLKRELKSKGLTVHLVSKETGIPSSTLHAWSVGQLPSAKNLKHIKTLCDYLKIPLSELLFNVREKESTGSILFSSTFVDEGKQYKLIIEKLPK